MIKEIKIKNLFNFKEEITIEFDSFGKEDTLFYAYEGSKISNLLLMYGKNNVGKTNFFKILEEVKRFVLTGNTALKPYFPALDENISSFEIIFQSENNQMRYGFDLLLKSKIVDNEWFYAKLKNSSRESLIFERKEGKFHRLFKAPVKSMLSSVKSNSLYLNHLYQLKEKERIIEDLLEAFNSIIFVNCHQKDLSEIQLETIFNISENHKLESVLNTFLSAADLDIRQIKTQIVDKETLDILERITAIDELEISEIEKNAKRAELIQESTSFLAKVIGKGIISVDEEFKAIKAKTVEFIHRSGASYGYNELSSGTKQFINIVLVLISNLKTSNILIFDEIELGLHIDLVDLIISAFKETIEIVGQTQIFISTHREELLDYDFIGKENKIFLKYDDDLRSPIVEYLSDYKIREYHKLSQRYRLDAFHVNPNTSYEYDLLTSIHDYINDLGTSYE